MLGISHREFGRRVGLSHTAVSQLVRRGIITALPDGSLDPVAAERHWRAHAQHVHPGQGANSIHRPARYGNGADKSRPFARARAARETYDARIQECRYRRLTGELVHAADVRAAAFAAGRRVRDLLLTLPGRVAPVVAGFTDPAECHRVIAQEIQRALDELATGTERARSGNQMRRGSR